MSRLLEVETIHRNNEIHNVTIIYCRNRDNPSITLKINDPVDDNYIYKKFEDSTLEECSEQFIAWLKNNKIKFDYKVINN